MPDWSYQTILRPWLFTMSAAKSRDLTLHNIGRLARSRTGRGLIDLMGHMGAPAGLTVEIGGIAADSPVGLGPALDPGAVATGAFDRFGFGFLEVGPVTESSTGAEREPERDLATESIVIPAVIESPGVEAVAGRIEAAQVRRPVGFRLAHAAGPSAKEAEDERCRVMRRLNKSAAFFTVDVSAGAKWSLAEWELHLSALQEAAAGTPIWLAIPPDVDWDATARIVDTAVGTGIRALVISGGLRDDQSGRRLGCPERKPALSAVSEAKHRWGDRISIIAGAGLIEPGDALRFLEAGATAVQIDAGLVYSGPGLPKRTNEVILASRSLAAKPESVRNVLTRSWFWLWLLGLAMIFGGTVAAIIAATRVVLPYDEAFIGMGAPGIRHINHHLLAFMTHDRITLAGTMISIGVLYSMMAWHGVRRGAHWAWKAILLSASVGFATFFLFLGFGYFDPLHATVSAILFVFFLAALHDRPTGVGRIVADLDNDRAWRRGLWGQLLFVVIGVGLILAGIAISSIGVSTVFIPTDLMFLHTSRDTVEAANRHLIPLIAHDRAGFGGALWSDGIAVLLLSLWGFRRSAKWVWHTLLWAGLPGFIAALGVHVAIGYMHFEHLFPVYLSIVLFTAGLALSREYLCGAE